MAQDSEERAVLASSAKGDTARCAPHPVDGYVHAFFLEFPVPLLIVNPHGNILDANSATSRLLGYDRGQLQRRTFMELMFRNPEEILDLLNGIRPRCVETLAALFRAFDGSPVEVEAHMRRTEANGGGFLCCVLHDMSLRNRRERERMEAQRLKAVETLATAMAHDFNNILSAILGFAEMTIGEVDLQPASALENQEQIVKAIARARAVVAQIQTFGQSGEACPAPSSSGGAVHRGANSSSEAAVPKSGGRILFVDDEEILVALGKGVIEHLGYEVEAVRSSKEALDLFRAAPDRFDLLITDHIMPKMTGAELVREVSAIRADFPAIVCSGTLSTAVHAGAGIPAIRRFVSKPFSISELDLAITEALEPFREGTGRKKAYRDPD